MKINGFSLPEPEETGINDIDLFVSIYKNNPNVYVITNKEVKEIFEKAKKFYLKSLDGLYKRIDNNGDDGKVYDVAKYINDIKDKKTIVKIFFYLQMGLYKKQFYQKRKLIILHLSPLFGTWTVCID